MKKLILLLALLLTSLAALAGGSSPGLYYGQVPTAAQWNSYFAAKLDYTPGATNTIPYWNASGDLMNASVSGDCTSVANYFTCAASSASGPIAATTLSASSAVSGVGFDALFASPPEIGGTVPASGVFTTVTATTFIGDLSGTATNAVYAYDGKNAVITADTNLQTWADGLPTVGKYWISLTSPQGNLPAGYWYIDINILDANAIVLIARGAYGNPGEVYSCTKQTTWGGWETTKAGTATNIAGGTQWGVLYQSASGVTASTSAGTVGQVLTSNGTSAPTFQDIAANVLNSGEATVTAHATTGDIFGASANSILWDDAAGPTTTTAFAAASKAGITRDLRLNNSSSFTASATIQIDGIRNGDTVTFSAGDTLKVRAITTTTSKLTLDASIDGEASVATTSGTSVSLTGIPAGVKRVTVMFNTVGTNGTSRKTLRIGSGSVLATGYVSTASYIAGGSAGGVTDTTGFTIYSNIAAERLNGRIVLELQNESANTWVAVYQLFNSASGTNYQFNGGGIVSLSGALDRVSLTTLGGTDTFVAGELFIKWEK